MSENLIEISNRLTQRENPAADAGAAFVDAIKLPVAEFTLNIAPGATGRWILPKVCLTLSLKQG